MKKGSMIEGANGSMRYWGVMQRPMTVEQQKQAGLIARVSRGIRPVKKKTEPAA